MSRLYLHLIIIVSFFGIVSCGSSGTDSPEPEPVPVPNTAPVADVTGPADIQTNSTATFDGSGSRDADGDTLTYSWTLATRPTGSSAVLSSSTTAQVQLMPDVDGAYAVELIVNDGMADSASVTGELTSTSPPNVPPVIQSFISEDLTLTVGDTARLTWEIDDPNSDALTCTLDPFGDQETLIELPNCDYSGSYTYQYLDGGSFKPSLTVRDPNGRTAGPRFIGQRVRVSPNFIVGLASLFNAVVREIQFVNVNISGTYVGDLDSVVVRFADREFELLPRALCSSCYEGFIDFSGLPGGAYTIVIVATLNNGVSTRYVNRATLDRKPVITVSGVSDGAVGLPAFSVQASCTDQEGDCTISVSAGSSPPVVSETDIDLVIDLSSEDNENQMINFTATDSIGQQSELGFYVFTENPDTLTRILESEEFIIDFDQTRLLTGNIVYPVFTNALRIRDRASDAVTGDVWEEEQPFFNAPFSTEFVRLSQDGAIFFRAADSEEIPPGPLYGFTDDTLALLHREFVPGFDIAGDYVVHITDYDQIADTTHTVVLENASTNTTQLIVLDGRARSVAVTDSGRVAIGGDKLWLYDQGLLSVVEEQPDTLYPRVDIDDTTILYVKQEDMGGFNNIDFSLYASTSNVSQLIDADINDSSSAVINNGWIAYVSTGQVKVRDPSGNESLRTGPLLTDRVEELAPNGELMLMTSNGRRLFSAPDSDTVDVSSANGRSRYLDGQWYVAIGNSLFEVAVP